MDVGQGVKESGRAEPQRAQDRQQGTCLHRGHVLGGRALEMERRHPPEEAGSSHTDHAPSAAAAPAPRAHAGTVTERVKAQDSTDTVSNEHHLGEGQGHQEGLTGGRRAP